MKSYLLDEVDEDVVRKVALFARCNDNIIISNIVMTLTLYY